MGGGVDGATELVGVSAVEQMHRRRVRGGVPDEGSYSCDRAKDEADRFSGLAVLGESKDGECVGGCAPVGFPKVFGEGRLDAAVDRLSVNVFELPYALNHDLYLRSAF